MAKTRRRAFDPTRANHQPGAEYGHRGNARGKPAAKGKKKER